MPQIIMQSAEYGTEEFDYNTLKEAREGFRRLKESCQAGTDEDGIERKLLLVVESWSSE
jgi:hypothetical protein